MKRKTLLKTSPIGYAAVKAIERKNDPARRAEAEAKAAGKAEADRAKAEGTDLAGGAGVM